MFDSTTRISEVLAMRGELLPVLATSFPLFAKLLHPVLGRGLAERLTVREAAEIAGTDVDALVTLLNAGDPEPLPGAGMASGEERPGAPPFREASSGGAPRAIR